MAAVVDPDGLKANWSLNVKAGGGDWNAGYRKRLLCLNERCCHIL